MVQAGCVIMTTSPSTRLWRPWNGDNEVDSASSIQNSEVISYKLENNLQNSAPIVTNSVDQRLSSQRMDHYSESSNHYSQRLNHYTQRFNHCTQRLDLHTQRCDRYSQRLDHFPTQGMSSDIFVPDNSSMALSCMDQDVASNRPTCYMDNMDVMLKVQDFGHFMAQPLGLYGFHQTSHRSSSNHTNVADEARFHLKCKEMAAAAAANGGKWKRERRSRPATATPPAYPLKTAQISQHPEPIDMSTRKIRGSPPSYSQTISAGYINRPPTTTTSPIANNSPITNTNSVTTEAEADSDLDSSMPVIDEHFRRSLGKHYQSVFAPSSASSASSSTSSSHSSSRPRIASNGQTTDDSSSDSADNAGSALSVDEHFAKALGETWLKLQQKEKSTSSATNGVSHSHSSSTMTITTTTNSPLVLVPSSVPDHSLLRVNRIEP